MNTRTLSKALVGLAITASGSAYADEVDPFAAEPTPDAAPAEPEVPPEPGTEPAPQDPFATPTEPAPDPFLEPAPEPVPEPEPEPVEPDLGLPPWYHGSGVVIGVKLGGAFSSVFNDFGASFVPELEVGWMLPFADRMLELFVSGRWSAPTTSGVTGPDPRLPGDGMMHYDVEQQTAAIGLGLRLRIDVADIFSPYVAVGGRVNLMRSHTNGEADGQPFGENTETSTNWGFFGALGGEIHVGPGAILIEIQANQVSMNHFVLQDTNLSSLDVFAGYRFMF